MIRSLFYFCLAGCVLAVLFGAGKGFYVLSMHEARLAEEGIVLSKLPAKRLYIDVMELHLYALWGAVAGLLLGIVWKLLAGLGTGLGRLFSARDSVDPQAYAAEEIIRRDQQARADAYLAQRRAERDQRDAR